MLAKIISAMALTLLLTGSALAFIPQPQGSLETELFAAEPAQPEQSSELAAAEPAQPEQGVQTELFAAELHNIYAAHSNSEQPQESSEAQLLAETPHNIYAGHSNSVRPQETSEVQLFAADTMPSEPRQFD
jgi:uncharacterized iron-regulated membrane protein